MGFARRLTPSTMATYGFINSQSSIVPDERIGVRLAKSKQAPKGVSTPSHPAKARTSTHLVSLACTDLSKGTPLSYPNPVHTHPWPGTAPIVPIRLRKQKCTVWNDLLCSDERGWLRHDCDSPHQLSTTPSDISSCAWAAFLFSLCSHSIRLVPHTLLPSVLAVGSRVGKASVGIVWCVLSLVRSFVQLIVMLIV